MTFAESPALKNQMDISIITSDVRRTWKYSLPRAIDTGVIRWFGLQEGPERVASDYLQWLAARHTQALVFEGQGRATIACPAIGTREEGLVGAAELRARLKLPEAQLVCGATFIGLGTLLGDGDLIAQSDRLPVIVLGNSRRIQ
jgi:hypothetical protein